MRLHVVSLLQPLAQGSTLKGSWRPKHIYLYIQWMFLTTYGKLCHLRMALPDRKVFFVLFKTIYEKQILAKAESNLYFSEIIRRQKYLFESF